jgi:anaerobic selenocysteine-containing dehydrogenase
MSELVVRGACHHDCPDTCAWEVTVVDGVATQLRGAAEHPVTQGTLCPKVNRFLDRVYHPDRVLRPLRRVGPKGGDAFEPFGWDEAIDEIASRMRTLMDAGRSTSILQFSFAGTQGVIQMGTMLDRLFDAVGASDVRRELCGTTSRLGAAAVLGQPFGIDPLELRHSRTILLWGTNTRITNRHLWPTIEQARKDGACVIVIDPVRTDTARAADVHLQLRPGSDVALVLAVIHQLDRQDLLDRDWIRDHTTGWSDLRASAADWTPERAAETCGLQVEQITWLAHRIATEQPTGIRTLIGSEHRSNGEQIARAVASLAAVLGCWRQPGGGLARSTAVWMSQALAKPRRTIRPSINMARLGEVLTDPQVQQRIELLFVHNSNPAVMLPDQNQVIAGLEREDLFTVVVDQFLTDTARYADIVLPATTQVEHLDLADSWGHLYLALNQPAIKPLGEALPNTEIARRLAKALHLDDPVLDMDDEELVRAALDSGSPYLDGISYELLQDQGWARLSVPPQARPHVDPLPGIPNGPMRLAALEHRPGPETVGGGSPLQARYPLALISRKQHPKFLNANYGGFPDHFPSVGEPTVQVHPVDAAARGITDQALVRVLNDRGELTLRAQVSEDVQPGLVAIPFGWWNASTPERRGVNALTNATVPDDDRGSAFFHDTLVEVQPL